MDSVCVFIVYIYTHTYIYIYFPVLFPLKNGWPVNGKKIVTEYDGWDKLTSW